MYQALQSIMLDSEVEETKDAADKEEEVKVVLLLSCQRLKTEYSGGDARWGHTRSHPEHDG